MRKAVAIALRSLSVQKFFSVDFSTGNCTCGGKVGQYVAHVGQCHNSSGPLCSITARSSNSGAFHGSFRRCCTELRRSLLLVLRELVLLELVPVLCPNNALRLFPLDLPVLDRRARLLRPLCCWGIIPITTNKMEKNRRITTLKMQ